MILKTMCFLSANEIVLIGKTTKKPGKHSQGERKISGKDLEDPNEKNNEFQKQRSAECNKF